MFSKTDNDKKGGKELSSTIHDYGTKPIYWRMWHIFE